jgi:hypothetical protein
MVRERGNGEDFFCGFGWLYVPERERDGVPGLVPADPDPETC